MDLYLLSDGTPSSGSEFWASGRVLLSLCWISRLFTETWTSVKTLRCNTSDREVKLLAASWGDPLDRFKNFCLVNLHNLQTKTYKQGRDPIIFYCILFIYFSILVCVLVSFVKNSKCTWKTYCLRKFSGPASYLDLTVRQVLRIHVE